MLPWRYNAGWAPQTRYTLRRNTASRMKGLVLMIPSVIGNLHGELDMYCIK